MGRRMAHADSRFAPVLSGAQAGGELDVGTRTGSRGAGLILAATVISEFCQLMGKRLLLNTPAFSDTCNNWFLSRLNHALSLIT